MIKEDNKIGVTETYDPSFDFSWMDNLYPVNIIITKNLSDGMEDRLLTEEVKRTCILHLTCTGWGGTFMEPGVDSYVSTIHKYRRLIINGFDPSHVVLRLDPIIPTEEGIERARSVLVGFTNLEEQYRIKRCRVSVLDNYKHVSERFKNIGFNLGYEEFQAPGEMFDKIEMMLIPYSDKFDFEICAEPELYIAKDEFVGCVSQKDIDLINPDFPVTLGSITRKQRPWCMCPDNKTNIIRRKPGRCPNKCVYCYWRD